MMYLLVQDYVIISFLVGWLVGQTNINLRMATAIFVETLDNSQYSVWLIQKAEVLHGLTLFPEAVSEYCFPF
jgi:hypothetical protein